MFKRFLSLFLVILLATASYTADTTSADSFSASTLESPEEIINAALEVYSWFAMQPLDVDPYSPNSNGVLFKVYDDRLDTMEELSAVLHEYFSDEICSELLSSGVYIEEDGALYTGMDFRTIDPTIASCEFYVSEETDTQIWYSAVVFYSTEEGEITSEEEYTFLREMVDDHWVFTDFWFFW